MINFNNIKDHRIERPSKATSLGAVEGYDNLADEFKDQIIFLNKEASKFIYEYLESAKFVTGDLWEPFRKENFKFTEEIDEPEDEKDLKKWLFSRGILFSKWVFLLPNYGDCPMILTWKMVIKNAGNIFCGDDIIIFDQTNQWCLVYWHEEKLFFGKVNTFDAEIGYQEMEELNEKKRKYPGFKHPYKD